MRTITLVTIQNIAQESAQQEMNLMTCTCHQTVISNSIASYEPCSSNGLGVCFATHGMTCIEKFKSSCSNLRRVCNLTMQFQHNILPALTKENPTLTIVPTL